GRNTTAGTLNFISRKPGDTSNRYLSIHYGNYDRAIVEGAIGGPLTDTLSGRVALQTVQQGSGWQTNRLTGDKVGEIDRTSGRAQIAWSPTEAVDVLLSGPAGTG